MDTADRVPGHQRVWAGLHASANSTVRRKARHLFAGCHVPEAHGVIVGRGREQGALVQDRSDQTTDWCPRRTCSVAPVSVFQMRTVP